MHHTYHIKHVHRLGGRNWYVFLFRGLYRGWRNNVIAYFSPQVSSRHGTIERGWFGDVNCSTSQARMNFFVHQKPRMRSKRDLNIALGMIYDSCLIDDCMWLCSCSELVDPILQSICPRSQVPHCYKLNALIVLNLNQSDSPWNHLYCSLIGIPNFLP